MVDQKGLWQKDSAEVGDVHGVGYCVSAWHLEALRDGYPRGEAGAASETLGDSSAKGWFIAGEIGVMLSGINPKTHHFLDGDDRIALQASLTELPNSRVESLKITSPSRLKTTILLR